LVVNGLRWPHEDFICVESDQHRVSASTMVHPCIFPHIVTLKPVYLFRIHLVPSGVPHAVHSATSPVPSGFCIRQSSCCSCRQPCRHLPHGLQRGKHVV
jgi:hypothetical protein